MKNEEMLNNPVANPPFELKVFPEQIEWDNTIPKTAELKKTYHTRLDRKLGRLKIYLLRFNLENTMIVGYRWPTWLASILARITPPFILKLADREEGMES